MEARTRLALALFLLLAVSRFHGSSAQPPLSEADINVLLEDLRSKNFFTGATILSYVARSDVSPGSTLLIPTDQSMSQVASIEPSDYAALIKFHILQTDFDFNQLRLLPVGTWIPTALQGYGVEVTNNSASDFSLNNAQIIDGDICPRVANIRLTCQGMSAVLNPSSMSSGRPSNPPLSPPPAFASAPTPTDSPMQFPSPSPSPLASEAPSASVSPLQFVSPASTPALSPSPSPSPSFSEPVPVVSSPAPSTFAQVPSSPIFQAPISSPISPSSPLQIPPFFEGAPSPGPSETSSGISSKVASQINTLALATLGGILLAMI